MRARRRSFMVQSVGARPAAVFLLLVLLLAAGSVVLTAQETPPEAPAGGTIPSPTDTLSPTLAISALPNQSHNLNLSLDPNDAQVRISEIMVLPLAASQPEGEWIELRNAGSSAVNLRDWTIASGDASFAVGVDLIVPAGGYVILGAEAMPFRNGGVMVDFQYLNLPLGNDGTLSLLTAGGEIVDEVTWSRAQVDAGKSLERADFGASDQWRLAWRAWQGSAGDFGSPRAENVPPPTPTATPVTPTRTPTATRTPGPTSTPRGTPPASSTPTMTRTPASTPTALPEAWLWLDAPSPLWFEEVAYRGGGEEYVVLGNRSDAPVDLAGWMLADATWPGANEGVVVLPERTLGAGDWVIVAHNGADFLARWGMLPHIQLESSSAPIPAGVADKAWGRGSFSLNDRGDTLLLLTPDRRIADAVSFGASGDAEDRVLLLPRISAPTNGALHRLPDARPSQSADQRDEWLVDAPSPFAALAVPGAPAARANSMLDSIYSAYWGDLNAVSSYSPNDGSALPARWHLRKAAVQGLDFVAFTDPEPHANLWEVPSTLTHLPAWRWQGGDGESAILYDNLASSFPDRWSLLPWLVQRHPLVQWVAGEAPALPGVSMVQVRGQMLEQVRARSLALWQSRGAPLLPVVDGWMTGVAAQERAANGLLEALENARGWTTSNAGLMVALTVDTANGRAWMGEEIDAANHVMVRVRASNASGAPVQVRMWQNGLVLFEGTLRAGDEIAQGMIAAPDAWLYVTAESAGESALSAPIHVRAETGGSVILTEALADPKSDWNGDGVIDDGDEFIELYNAGSRPVLLAGWKLQDKREAQDGGGEYRFGANQVIAAGAYLVVWRGESRTVLNSNDEALFLRSPGGGMASEVWWDETLPPDRSMARVGNTWAFGVPPSPGRAADGSYAAMQDFSGDDIQRASALATVEESAITAPAWRVGEVVTFVGAVAGIGEGRILLADLIHPSSAPLVVRVGEGVSLPAMAPGEVWKVSGVLVQGDGGASWLEVESVEGVARVKVE